MLLCTETGAKMRLYMCSPHQMSQYFYIHNDKSFFARWNTNQLIQAMMVYFERGCLCACSGDDQEIGALVHTLVFFSCIHSVRNTIENLPNKDIRETMRPLVNRPF